MTLHQPFYELAKQNLTELYIIWSVAALIIIAGTLFLIFMFVTDKIERYRDKKKRERIEKADKEFYDNLGKEIILQEGHTKTAGGYFSKYEGDSR